MTIVATTYGVEISGFGVISGATPLRYLLTSRISPSITKYESAPIIAKFPSVVSTRVNILNSTCDMGTFRFKVGLTDQSPVARELRNWVFQSRPERSGLVYSAIDSTTDPVTFGVSLESPSVGFAANQAIYIGREALKINSVTAPSGGFQILTCSRAIFGTAKQFHDAGPLDDRDIYLVNPVVLGREVTIFDIDIHDPNVSSPIWRGIIDSVNFDEGLSMIDVACRDTFATYGRRKVGEGRSEIFGVVYNPPARDASETVFVTIDESDFSTLSSDESTTGLLISGETTPATLPEIPYDTYSGYRAYIQSDCIVLMYGTIRFYSSGFRSDSWNALGDGVPTLLGTVCENDETQNKSKELLRECLVASKGTVSALINESTPNVSHFADENGDQSFHPCDIFLCLLTSTGTASWEGVVRTSGNNGDWDWLPSYWGLGVPENLVDSDGIKALRDGYLRGASCEALVIGEEKKSEDANKVFEKLLSPMLVFPCLNEEGLITLKQFRDVPLNAVVANIGDGDLVDYVQRQPYSTQERIDVVKVKACERPGEKNAVTFINADGAGKRAKRYPFGSKDLTVDAGWYGDPVSQDVSTVSDLLREVNSLRYLYVSDRLPEYTVEVRAGLPLIPAGSYISLTCRAIVAPGGSRGITNARCFVKSSSRNTGDRSQTLDLINVSQMTKADSYVSPSMLVDTGAHTTTSFLVDLDRFSSDDPSYFEIGDVVSLYDARGVRKSAADGTISGKLGTSFTLAPGFSVAPVAGDIIRLPDYADRVSSQEIYSWIADIDGTLDGDDADRWST